MASLRSGCRAPTGLRHPSHAAAHKIKRPATEFPNDTPERALAHVSSYTFFERFGWFVLVGPFRGGWGSVTTTLVDLTEATASTPGSNPSSSTASADISDAIRCGPDWNLHLSHHQAPDDPGD